MKQHGLILVALSLAAGGGGCGNECEAIAEKMLECSENKPEGIDKGQLEAACELMMSSDEGKKELAAEAKCAKLKTCDEYNKCMGGARAEQAAERVAKEAADGKWEDALMSCRINVDEYKTNDKLKSTCDDVFKKGIPALIAAGKGDDAMSSCRYSDDLLEASAAFKEACGKAAGGALEDAKKKAMEFRDKGKDDFGTCSDLKELAEKAGGDNVKLAEQLCGEMKFAERAAKGIESAKANITAKKGDLPFECKYAMEGYDEMTEKSEWVEKRVAEVLKTCYIELGKVLIEVELPKARICGFQIRNLREAADKRQLKGKDPAFDEALAKTDKLCAK